MSEGFTNVAGQRLDVPDPSIALQGVRSEGQREQGLAAVDGQAEANLLEWLKRSGDEGEGQADAGLDEDHGGDRQHDQTAQKRRQRAEGQQANRQARPNGRRGCQTHPEARRQAACQPGAQYAFHVTGILSGIR